jgi:hypothetical protein
MYGLQDFINDSTWVEITELCGEVSRAIEYCTSSSINMQVSFARLSPQTNTVSRSHISRQREVAVYCAKLKSAGSRSDLLQITRVVNRCPVFCRLQQVWLKLSQAIQLICLQATMSIPAPGKQASSSGVGIVLQFNAGEHFMFIRYEQ